MTKISEAIDIALPANVAQENILKYFDRVQAQNGGKIALRVSLKDFGFPEDIAVEREVLIHVSKQRDAENLNDELAVRWEPLDGAAFPAFSGRLIVWSEDRPDVSFVELQGDYHPPLAVAGEFFDAAIGHLIAQRTARELLVHIRDEATALATPARN